MASVSDIVLQKVFPTLGVFTGIFMSFAPFRAVLKASRDGHLGDLNPTPWVFMLGNCCGWVAYSYLLQNMYVFVPNAPGFILAIWLNIQAIKLQYENYRSTEMQNAIISALEEHSKKQIDKKEVKKMVKNAIAEDPVSDGCIIDPTTTAPISDEETVDSDITRQCAYESVSVTAGDDDGDGFEKNDDGITSIQEATEMIVDYASFIWDIAAQKTPAPASHELMVLAISTVWLFLISVVVFTQSVFDENKRILIIGLAVNLNLIFFYGAPLSKIATVLETKSSKSIHFPTMITSLVNGSLWSVYGIAVSDYFIALPNTFGAVLGVIQLILCLFYPRHREHSYEYGVIKAHSSSSLSLPLESTPLI